MALCINKAQTLSIFISIAADYLIFQSEQDKWFYLKSQGISIL